MKFIVKWDAGCGVSYEEVDVDTIAEAEEYAYQSWNDEKESAADYGVIGEATDELREEYL